jgi:hypothetical protein
MLRNEDYDDDIFIDCVINYLPKKREFIYLLISDLLYCNLSFKKLKVLIILHNNINNNNEKEEEINIIRYLIFSLIAYLLLEEENNLKNELTLILLHFAQLKPSLFGEYLLNCEINEKNILEETLRNYTIQQQTIYQLQQQEEEERKKEEEERMKLLNERKKQQQPTIQLKKFI